MKEAERELEPFRQLRPTARRLRTIKLNLAAIRGLFDYLQDAGAQRRGDPVAVSLDRHDEARRPARPGADCGDVLQDPLFYLVFFSTLRVAVWRKTLRSP